MLYFKCKTLEELKQALDKSDFTVVFPSSWAESAIENYTPGFLERNVAVITAKKNLEKFVGIKDILHDAVYFFSQTFLIGCYPDMGNTKEVELYYKQSIQQRTASAIKKINEIIIRQTLSNFNIAISLMEREKKEAPYKKLGITSDASDNEVNEAYHKKMKSVHKDKVEINVKTKMEQIRKEYMENADKEAIALTKAREEIRKQRGQAE